jgi:hypothetical protein
MVRRTRGVKFQPEPGSGEKEYKREETVMRNLRIVVCTAILLLTAGFAGAQTQDQLSNVAGTGTSNPFLSSTAIPSAVVVDSSGNVYISDFTDCVVYELSGGTLTAIAGTAGSCGYGGDSGPATSAQINSSYGLALDSAGDLFIADSFNCVVREVTAPLASGTITTIAGTPGTCSYSGDTGPATSATLNLPTGVAVDSMGDVFISDAGNSVIREVSGGNINTVAGDGTAGFMDESTGTPLTAEFQEPFGLSLDSTGNLYIADPFNNAIRKLDTSGNVTTVAGDGSAGYGSDGVAATSTSLDEPTTVAVDGAGDLTIADYGNNRIRWVDTAGIIQTVAGNGSMGASTPGLATNSDLDQPYGAAVGSSGNIYFSDALNYQVDKITAVSELGSSTTSLTFATQTPGTTSASQPVVLTATGYDLNISSIVSSSSKFTQSGCPTGILPSGTSCTINVSFAPTQSGPATGTITITDNSFLGTTVVINVSGTGGSQITLSPNPLVFGPQSVLSTSAPQSVVFTNIGSVALTGVTPSVTGDFSISSNDCGTAGNGHTVNANSSCSFLIVFRPTAVGARTGTLSVSSSDAFSPSSIGLQGSGTGTALSPNPLAFPTKIVGISQTELLTVTNSSGQTLSSIAYSFSGPNASDFVVEATGTTCTSTLKPGKFCKYRIQFTPVVNGAESATFTVTDNFGTEPMTATLTGNGTGTGAASLGPATSTFPATKVGTTSGITKVLTVISHTHISLGLAASITGANAGDFHITNASGSCSGTLASEPANCTFDVSFTPSVVGPETATFQVVVSDGSGTVSTLTSTLNGSGK